MEAKDEQLIEFLSATKRQFVIPIYQRNYNWKQKHCKQLLTDILEVAESKKIKAHFLGSIVFTHENDDTDEFKFFNIIDGQQRISTIVLIFLALRKIAKELGELDLVEEIEYNYLMNRFNKNSEKYKLKQADSNNEELQKLIQGTEIDDFKTDTNLIRNYGFFISEINENNYKQVKKGLNKLKIVKISLEIEKDDPQRIFESLNSTGLDLTQADLIRNYLLMGIKPDDQNEIFHKYWGPIERNAYDEVKNESRVSEFIRDYLTNEDHNITKIENVYSSFKKKYPLTYNKDTLKKTLKPLKELSKDYNKLLNPNNEKDAEIRTELKYIHKIQMSVCYPFLMNVYKDFRKKIIEKKDFIKILNLVQSYTFRRFIVKLPSNELNKVFMKLYSIIDEKQYVKSVEEFLVNRKDNQSFPTDYEIILELKTRNMYNSDIKKRYYLFERLENYKNKERILLEGNKDISIEHIFPRNPDKYWKKAIKKNDYNLLSKDYLHTIGNLTFSANNSSLSNKIFTEKKNMNKDNKKQGYKYSKLWLNEYLKKIDNWSIENYKTRTKILSDRFIQVWSFPNDTKRNSFSTNLQSSLFSEEVNIFDAPDPTNMSLDYFIFMDELVEVDWINQFFEIIINKLFELYPNSFHSNKEIIRLLRFTSKETDCKIPVKVGNKYFIHDPGLNKSRFRIIKELLEIFEFENDLFIKFSE